MGLLILHPMDPRLRVAEPDLIDRLRKLGLVGEPALWQPFSWHTGADFLRQIAFMGCSPHIRLDPESPEDRGWTWLSLDLRDQPVLRHGRNTRPPVCPSCRKRVKDFPIDQPLAELECPHCGAQAPIYRFGWKNTAGIASLFVELHNIYPGEAVPVDALLQQLEAIYGCAWGYFYLLP